MTGCRGPILVVDDDPDMQVFLANLLTEGGFEALVADSGPEGLRLAKDVRPALIVLDARLSRRPGEDVYRSLKLDPKLRRIPVIMLSLLPRKTCLYYRKLADSRQGERLPEPEAFLDKPPEADDLLGRVRRLVTAGGRGATADAAAADRLTAAGAAGSIEERRRSLE